MTDCVEIRGCILEVGGSVRWAAPHEIPQHYGVYIGQPGSMRWTADFLYHEDAVNWAYEVAENNEITLEDRWAEVTAEFKKCES